MLREMLAIEAAAAPSAAARKSASVLLNAAESSCRIVAVPGRLPSPPSQDAVRATRSNASKTWPPSPGLDAKPCVACKATSCRQPAVKGPIPPAHE